MTGQRALRAIAMRAALAIACGCALGGCYFSRSPIRPIPALAFARDAGVRQSCLVIFVPGLMDGPDSFLEHGMARDLLASGARCDAVAVDLTYRYYFGAQPDRALYEDVLAVAVARGYEEIWVVGISLGGLGAVLLARAHPELIDGVVLLSPFLGLAGVVEDIERAGGLASWRPPETMPATVSDDDFTLFVWSWLHGYVDDPDAMPPLHLGWANGETRERTALLLAAVLPEGHAASVEGRHDWAAWTRLFGGILTRARIGRRAADQP